MIILLLYSMLFGAPYAAVGSERLAVIMELLSPKKGEKIADLGSGDGRIVIQAAKQGAKATGYEINPVLVVAMSGIFLSIFVLSIINTYIKASIHVASIAALIFSFNILYNGFFLLLLFLIPLIAWSRLKVHRHTMQEVIAGLLVGIFIPLVVYLVFKVLLQISLSV